LFDSRTLRSANFVLKKLILLVQQGWIKWINSDSKSLLFYKNKQTILFIWTGIQKKK